MPVVGPVGSHEGPIHARNYGFGTYGLRMEIVKHSIRSYNIILCFTRQHSYVYDCIVYIYVLRYPLPHLAQLFYFLFFGAQNGLMGAWEVLKSFLEAVRFILTEYEPVASHRDPIHGRCHSFGDHVLCAHSGVQSWKPFKYIGPALRR